jgi:hypothetical protein
VQQGHGIYTYSDGGVYNGDWVNGQRHGRGKCIDKNGNVLISEWHNDKPHGRSSATYHNLSIYDTFEGTTTDGGVSGTLTYKNRPVASYRGSIVDGQYSGKGAVLYRNGDRFEGVFVKGKKSGKGIQTFKKHPRSLLSSDGDWLEDKFTNGVMLYTNGNSYNGQLQSGEYHGQGVFTLFNDDMMYSGSWFDGKRSGAGQITFGNHGVFIDLFDNDKAVGSTDAKFVNNTTGIISTGNTALQLARDHGAEQFVQRARKQTRRLVDDMNATAAAATAATTAAKRAKRADAATAATAAKRAKRAKCAQQRRQKIASAAARAAAIAPNHTTKHTTSDVQDAECDDNSSIDDAADSASSQSDDDDQNGDSSDDENNTVANADTTTAATTDAADDTQSCVYAYTLPAHSAFNSDGKAFHIIGSHNTLDIIDHLEQTVDIASTGGYTVKLVIPCAQGTQQQLEKAIRNKLIASNVRPNSDGAFLTSLSQLALLHIICLGGQVNM